MFFVIFFAHFVPYVVKKIHHKEHDEHKDFHLRSKNGTRIKRIACGERGEPQILSFIRDYLRCEASASSEFKPEKEQQRVAVIFFTAKTQQRPQR